MCVDDFFPDFSSFTGASRRIHGTREQQLSYEPGSCAFSFFFFSGPMTRSVDGHKHIHTRPDILLYHHIRFLPSSPCTDRDFLDTLPLAGAAKMPYDFFSNGNFQT